MAKNYWNVKALALAFGLFSGSYLFLAALFEMGGMSFWWFQPQYFAFLVPAFPGLAATLVGAVFGLVLGFICGAVCGVILAWLYNTSLRKWC